MRAKGGRGTRKRPPIRTVAPDGLPDRPLDNLDGVIAWLVQLAHDTYTGRVDPATSRETNRVLTTLKEAFKVQGYQRRIRELEQIASRYEKELSRHV